jgi:hypothetical protein
MPIQSFDTKHDLVRRQPITHDFFVVSSRDPHHGLAG